MAHNVIELAMTASYNVDALNRTAKCAEDIDNGSVFMLSARSKDAGERYVWEASKPAADTAMGVWMAASPEVVITKGGVDGVAYRGLTPDPRAFVNVAGQMIDAFKPQAGDIIRMTAAGIAGADTNDYLVIEPNKFVLKSNASATDGFCLHKIGTTHLRIGQGGIVNAPVVMYEYEVVRN